MDRVLMEGLLVLPQESLKKYMAKYLIGKYKKVIVKKEFIYAIGTTPITLLAHMDTVFEKTPFKANRKIETYYDKKKKILWSPQGAGFDDRAGVYAIIQLIERGFRPSIVLTTDEECGGLGAAIFSKMYTKPLTKTNFLIQLDRQGQKDCVFYDCDNEKFVKYIESFGFEEGWGSYTDICEIASVWGIAAVNLSIGYIDEHSKIERLHVDWMEDTINKVQKILSQDKIKCFKYIPVRNYYSKYYYSNYGYDYGYGYNTCTCGKCHKQSNEYEVFPIKLGKGITSFYCADCISDFDKVNWCKRCGEAYLRSSSPGIDSLCTDCREKKGNVSK